MKPNKLRELLNADKPSIGTRVHSTWPSVVEAIGHTGMFDYVEFLAEYAPFDLYSLDNFCRAVELFDMSAIIKVDQEPRGFFSPSGVLGPVFRVFYLPIAAQLMRFISVYVSFAPIRLRMVVSTVLRHVVLLIWAMPDRSSMFRRSGMLSC